MLKSQAENKINEVKGLVNEANQQIATNSQKAKVEKIVESIASDIVTKMDEAKVSTFLNSTLEVIP